MNTKLAEQMFPIYDFILYMSTLENTEDEQAGKYLVAHWPYMKEELIAQMEDGQKLDMYTVKIRVPDNKSIHMMSLRIYFRNLMNEADLYYENAKQYEEEISFFQDVLEIFDLSGEINKLTRDNFTSAIGMAYHFLGRKEERDRYFIDLLAGQERNDYVAARYAFTLLQDKDLERAERFLANYRDSKEELMLERFEWLDELRSASNQA